jgi:hypothetical protein
VVGAVGSNDVGEALVVVDECGRVLQLEGGKGAKRGWLIEKDKGSRRRSSMKADDGAVRAKSRVGRNPLVADGG